MTGPRRLEDRLLQPFETISAAQALLLGLVALLATAVLAAQAGLQTRGVLELQFAAGGSVWILIVQGLINWLSLAVALLISARWLSAQPVSAMRLLAFQAAARWPLLLSTMYLSIPPLGNQIRELTQRLVQAMPQEPGQVMSDAAYLGDAFVLTLLGVPLLVFLVWMVWLMFQGYRVASGLRGPPLVFSFGTALAVAYLASKVLIRLLA